MDVGYLKNAEVWQRMSHISLEEMKNVRLMSRVDTKFVAGCCQLPEILEKAADHSYSVQFANTTLNFYDTVYYDTENLSMYITHHNRKLCRQKIRCRTYTDTNISFFEIKNKNNKGRTNKVRIPVIHPETNLLYKDSNACKFLRENSIYTMNMLIPALRTQFFRITLVNKERTERITIDIGLTFQNFTNGCIKQLNDFIIIELKQDGRYTSTMKEILRQMRIKPFKFSKYCIGTVLTNPDVKSNRFHRKIHLMAKMKKQFHTNH